MPQAEIVQALWVQGELPLLQQLSIASFLAHGHEYHLYTYDPGVRAPEGTTVCDGSEILPDGKVFRDKYGYGAFSDCFRYRLLLLRGGWWVDTDLICLKHFAVDAPYVFASEHLPGAGGTVAASGVIKTPAGAPLIECADGVCSSKDLGKVEWGELGPALLGDSIRRFSLEEYMMPPEAFCPIPWFRLRDVVDPTLRIEFGEATYAVHLWNAMWGRQGMETGAAYHPECAYEGWKREFLSTGFRKNGRVV